MIRAVRGASVAALLLGLAQATPARADPPCPGVFADGRAPAILNPRLAVGTEPLCYDAFAVLHSAVSRTPLYAAEHLTRASVAAARRVERIDEFHEEARLPETARASLGDYVRSGYDRGHMAPAGDMPTLAAQAQSFTLANIVPQDRAANRGVWAAIEESVRRLATERGSLFVVTGPIFSGAAVRSLDGRVLVPTQIYKAVYDPGRAAAGAYLAPNDAGGAWRAVSLAALRDASGIDAFPGLSDPVKATAMPLPEPRDFSRGEARGEHREGASLQSWLRHALHTALRRLWRDLVRAVF